MVFQQGFEVARHLAAQQGFRDRKRPELRRPAMIRSPDSSRKVDFFLASRAVVGAAECQHQWWAQSSFFDVTDITHHPQMSPRIRQQ